MLVLARNSVHLVPSVFEVSNDPLRLAGRNYDICFIDSMVASILSSSFLLHLYCTNHDLQTTMYNMHLSRSRLLSKCFFYNLSNFTTHSCVFVVVNVFSWNIIASSSRLLSYLLIYLVISQFLLLSFLSFILITLLPCFLSFFLFSFSGKGFMTVVFLLLTTF